MTRARARAIENEVDSLLFKFWSDSHENWVLPHKDLLCILGYQGDDREKEKVKVRASMEQEKEGEDKKNEGKESLDTPGARAGGPRVPGRAAKGRANPTGHPGCTASLAPDARQPPGPRPCPPRVPGPPPSRRLGRTTGAGPHALAARPARVLEHWIPGCPASSAQPPAPAPGTQA